MQKNDNKLVSVVVVTYNGKQLLAHFLPSVANLKYPNYEVIIVENASSDGSAEFIETNYPQFKVIRNVENQGTAEGSNVGARRAKGEYIFWISNDMWLDPDILTRIVKRMEEDENVGICTVKMRRITRDGIRLMELDSVGADLDIFGFPSARGINQKDEGQLDEFREVFFSFGGAMMLRKNLFEQTGGFDPETFTLADDIDLSWRVHLLGYKVVVEPKAFLYHRVSATLGSIMGRSHRRFLSERNTLRMLLKNYSIMSLCWVLPCYFVLLGAEFCFYLAIGKFQIAKSIPRSILWNIVRIGDIMRRRRLVQESRVVGDKVILGLMSKTSHKLQIFSDYLRRYNEPDWKSYFGERVHGEIR